MWFVLISLFACVGDVRPGPDGINSIVLVTDDKMMGSRQMIRQAKRYCKRQDQGFVIHDENATFVCDMDEEDYIRAKNLADAAQVAGNATWSTSEENTTAETIGEVLSAGGAIADEALGDCYELELLFECVN